MTEKITVYIGDGSTLDGGPFQREAIADHDDEHVHVYDHVDGSEEHTTAIPRYEVTELADAIIDGQPGRITAVAKSESFMRVRIECHDGVLFESDGMVASGEELRSSGDLRRQMSRAFRNHGGEVSENY